MSTRVDTQQPASGNSLQQPAVPGKHRVLGRVPAQHTVFGVVSETGERAGQHGLGRAAVTNSPPDLDDLKRRRQTVSVKGRVISSLGFVGHAAPQQLLWHQSSFGQNMNVFQ